MSAARLRIGPDLSLPLDFVTQTSGILGKRGVGKTHLATVMAEELLEHGLQVVIVDPIGVWHGLRSSADGKGAGYPILILGGEHGDLPIEPSSGPLVADFVVTKRASVVVDLGLMRKGDQVRFVTDFLEQLYRKNRQALHLVLDEADAFAPQRTAHGMERCLGAVNDVVRRGRARGLGCTLVTQRSAAINKDVLTQIEVLIAFRTIGPHDRAAIEAWVEVHGDREMAAKMLANLPTLETGEAWVWSPAWLDIFKRVRIRARRTFDSSATPKAGARVAAPKKIARVDVEQLGQELKSLTDKARAEDPRELKKVKAALEGRIAQLERELAKKVPPPAPKVERVEVPIISEVKLERIAAALEKLHQEIETRLKDLAQLHTEYRAARVVLATMSDVRRPASSSGRVASPTVGPRPAVPVQRPTPASGNGHSKLTRAMRALLAAIAQRHPKASTRSQVSILSGYSIRSSSFSNALSELRTGGYVESQGPDANFITEIGLAAAEPYEPPPQGEQLIAMWLAKLQKAERALFQYIVHRYPNAVPRGELSEQTGYSVTSSSFTNALSTLRTLELIEGRGELVASKDLFDE